MNQAEKFVQSFTRFWEAPESSDLAHVLHDDVRLVAPMMPATADLEQGRAAFARIFALLPGLHARVNRWGAAEDVVYIEFTMEAPVGNTTLRWEAVDRFILRGDKAIERVSYFDPTTLLLAVLRRPRLWLRAWQALRRVPQSPSLARQPVSG